MNNSCPFGGTCWVSCAFCCLGWLLASSALVYFSWNKVICSLSSFKKMKPWHPLLLLVTFCAIAVPFKMKRGGHHCEMGAHHGDCPYESKAGETEKK